MKSLHFGIEQRASLIPTNSGDAQVLCSISTTHLRNRHRPLIQALVHSRSISATRMVMQAPAGDDAGRDGEPLVEVERKFALVAGAEEAVATCMTFVKEVKRTAAGKD